MKDIEKIKNELIAIQDFLKDKHACLVITKDSIECLSQNLPVETINLQQQDNELHRILENKQGVV
jgi:hypothetical protein